MSRFEAWCIAVGAVLIVLGLINAVYQMGGIG